MKPIPAPLPAGARICPNCLAAYWEAAIHSCAVSERGARKPNLDEQEGHYDEAEE